MKNLFRILSFIILFFILILESFAIDAPTNLSLDSSTESSVNLSWDVTENAFMYYVYYSKQSGLETGYDMQTDFIESNSLKINDLEIWSTYYFVAVALDENWNESVYSNELIVDITSNIIVDFALDSIEVIDYNKIELDFTNGLEDSKNTLREFKIINKNDNLDTFEVISTKLNSEDNSKLELTLDRDTKIWNEYEVVIIAITSVDWENIESWIDNTEIFIVEEIIIELNSAIEKVVWPTWTNIESSEIENTTLALAKTNDSLPKTGPEHIFMLILSIILWALIFVFRYKKAQ